MLLSLQLKPRRSPSRCSNFGTIAGLNQYCTPLSLWKARHLLVALQQIGVAVNYDAMSEERMINSCIICAAAVRHGKNRAGLPWQRAHRAGQHARAGVLAAVMELPSRSAGLSRCALNVSVNERVALRRSRGCFTRNRCARRCKPSGCSSTHSTTGLQRRQTVRSFCLLHTHRRELLMTPKPRSDRHRLHSVIQLRPAWERRAAGDQVPSAAAARQSASRVHGTGESVARIKSPSSAPALQRPRARTRLCALQKNAIATASPAGVPRFPPVCPPCPQVQGQLHISGRAFARFLSFVPGVGATLHQVERSQAYWRASSLDHGPAVTLHRAARKFASLSPVSARRDWLFPRLQTMFACIQADMEPTGAMIYFHVPRDAC